MHGILNSVTPQSVLAQVAKVFLSITSIIQDNELKMPSSRMLHCGMVLLDIKLIVATEPNPTTLVALLHLAYPPLPIHVPSRRVDFPRFRQDGFVGFYPSKIFQESCSVEN